MKSSREQFEEWYKKSMLVRVAWYGEENIKSDLVCEADGTYIRVRVRDKWEAWQASRAAIDIAVDYHTEEEINIITETEKDGYALGWIDGRNYAVKQIKRHGLKVGGEA